VVARPTGAQSIRDAVASAMRALGPEKEQAIRRAAEKTRSKEEAGAGTKE